jgi:hypothetical protein
VTFEPICPGPPNRRGQNEVIPQIEKYVNVHEVSDILIGALSKYLLVYTGSV